MVIFFCPKRTVARHFIRVDLRQTMTFERQSWPSLGPREILKVSGTQSGRQSRKKKGTRKSSVLLWFRKSSTLFRFWKSSALFWFRKSSTLFWFWKSSALSGSARFPSGWFRTVPYQLLQKRNVGWTCKNNMTFLTRTITRRGIQSYHLYNI